MRKILSCLECSVQSNSSEVVSVWRLCRLSLFSQKSFLALSEGLTDL